MTSDAGNRTPIASDSQPQPCAVPDPDPLRVLAKLAKQAHDGAIDVGLICSDGTSVEFPRSIFAGLGPLFDALAEGRCVSIFPEENVPIDAAAELLGVEREAVQRMIDDGTLTGIRPSNDPLVPLAEVFACLESDEEEDAR